MFRTAMALLSIATVGSSFAQEDASKKPSLYMRMGGIHKIASLVDMEVDLAIKNKVLLKSERFAQAVKMTPVPAIKFFVTNYIASKTGGPQMVTGQWDIAGIHKWFMFNEEQVKEFMNINAMVGKKLMLSPAVVTEFGSWLNEAVTMAEAQEPTLEVLQEKESLYARLGGCVPVSMVVDTFVNRLATDKTLLANPRTVKALSGGHVSTAGLKYLLTEQLCATAGGPWKYSGRSMAESHKGLMITEKEWDAGVKILSDVLNMYKVPKKEQNEIFAAIGSTKRDIVGG